jgi:hypothetical protein
MQVEIMRACIMVCITIVTTVGLYGAVRFSDNRNGTVTDNGTGLVWQKCSMGQNMVDCNGADSPTSWYMALSYCRSLSLDGRSWRLPSVNELKSIADTSLINPAINTKFFPNTPNSRYWSSSTLVSTTTGAWVVIFVDGQIAYIGKTSARSVRCVADGP